MGDPKIESELDQLLSEGTESAARRAKSSTALAEGPLVLYGAGNLGQSVLAGLRRHGIEPVAFADDTPEKQGRVISGLPVMTPSAAAVRFGARAVFVVTILNPFASFLKMERRLRQLTSARVLPFLHIAWSLPEAFLPYFQFELPQHVLPKAREIKRAFHILADDESRRQFVAHIRFRLLLDYTALPASSQGNLFPPCLLAPLPPDVTFVDCGAYDGDTVRRFLTRQRDKFRRIYAFEPDETNCRRLREYVAGMSEEVAQRVSVYQAAVGERRGRRRFSSTGNTGAALEDNGNVEVEVLPLQEAIEEHSGTFYIKFDVEGAEREALAGADLLIRRARPIIAVSVYHRPDDLWKIPLYLQSLNLGYKLFLRTQGEDGMDVVCYATQRCHLSRPALVENHD